MPRRKRTTALTIRELEPGARVYVYLRDSGGTGQERSVEEQRAAVERFCHARSWIIADWYTDEATQSGNYLRRTQFAALLDACRRDPPPVDGVVTYSFARFGRDEVDSQFYRLDLRRHGVQVDSVIDDVPAGPMAAVIEAVIDTQNRLFLDNMAHHVREGLLYNVQAGCAPGGRPPTGYVAEPVELGRRRDGSLRIAARWVVDPDVGPRVTLAFRLAAEGVPYKRVLAETGVPVREDSLRAILINETYTGVYKLGSERFPGPEPLIDRETFERVQARMTTRAQQAGKAKRMKNTPFILTGLVVCGNCGSLLDADTDRRNVRAGKTPRPWRSYRCRECDLGRVNAVVLETNVVQRLLDDVINPEVLGRMLERMRELLHDPSVETELEQRRAEIADKRRAIGHLQDAIEQGAGPTTLERLKLREAELAQLEARRRGLEERLALASVQLGTGDVQVMVDEMRRQVEAEDAGAAKQALRQWLERVRVWSADRFEPEYRSLEGDVGYQSMPPRGDAMMPYNVVKLASAYARNY